MYLVTTTLEMLYSIILMIVWPFHVTDQLQLLQTFSTHDVIVVVVNDVYAASQSRRAQLGSVLGQRYWAQLPMIMVSVSIAAGPTIPRRHRGPWPVRNLLPGRREPKDKFLRKNSNFLEKTSCLRLYGNCYSWSTAGAKNINFFFDNSMNLCGQKYPPKMFVIKFSSKTHIIHSKCSFSFEKILIFNTISKSSLRQTFVIVLRGWSWT